LLILVQDRSGSASSVDSFNVNDELARFEDRLGMKIPTVSSLSLHKPDCKPEMYVLDWYGMVDQLSFVMISGSVKPVATPSRAGGVVPPVGTRKIASNEPSSMPKQAACKVIPTASAKSTPIKSPDHKKPRCLKTEPASIARNLDGELRAASKVEPSCSPATLMDPPTVTTDGAGDHGEQPPVAVTWIHKYMTKI